MLGILLSTCLLLFLIFYKIGLITSCVGQLYDNVSNITGKYNGVKVQIKNITSIAVFVSYAVNLLNLIGINLILIQAVNYFVLVQAVYDFPLIQKDENC